MNGFVAVTPGDAATLATSTLNLNGTPLANGGTVTIAGDRTIKVFVGGGGSTQVIVDVTGYYTPTGSGPQHGQLTRPSADPHRADHYSCEHINVQSVHSLTEVAFSRTDGSSAGSLDVSGDQVLQHAPGGRRRESARRCSSPDCAGRRGSRRLMIDVPSSPAHPA